LQQQNAESGARSTSPAAPIGSWGGHRSAPRVLYVWDDEYPWDVRTEKVCAALTAHGHEVHLVARNRRWAPRSERLAEGIVHRMPPWRALGKRVDGALAFPAFFNPRWVSLLTRTVRSVRPDVIIARDLPLCPTALHVGRKFGLPVILDMAENYPALVRSNWEAGRHSLLDYAVRNPAAVSAVERYCVSRVARTLVVIEESGERLVRDLGASPDSIDVVSNTPPRARAEQARRGPRASNAPLELVYLGIFEVPRGIGEMLDAVARLRGRARIHLTLVGDGRDMPLFRAQAERLGLTRDEVDFRGFVPHEEALSIVARADVGLVPHHAVEAWNTTIPNKLFDYMAAGLAVITSDAAPAARIVRTTGAGEVFRAGDASDLAGAIERLVAPERCAAAARAGRRAILERYHWEQDAATLARAVSLVARTPAPAVRIGAA
jgi:glycosyltransferase involved in cell wall biosynthesis